MAVGDVFIGYGSRSLAGSIDVRPASGTEVLVTCVFANAESGRLGRAALQLVSSVNSNHLILFPGDFLDVQVEELPNASPISTEKLILTNGQYLRMSKTSANGLAHLYVSGIVVKES